MSRSKDRKKKQRDFKKKQQKVREDKQQAFNAFLHDHFDGEHLSRVRDTLDHYEAIREELRPSFREMSYLIDAEVPPDDAAGDKSLLRRMSSFRPMDRYVYYLFASHRWLSTTDVDPVMVNALVWSGWIPGPPAYQIDHDALWSMLNQVLCFHRGDVEFRWIRRALERRGDNEGGFNAFIVNELMLNAVSRVMHARGASAAIPANVYIIDAVERGHVMSVRDNIINPVLTHARQNLSEDHPILSEVREAGDDFTAFKRMSHLGRFGFAFFSGVVIDGKPVDSAIGRAYYIDSSMMQMDMFPMLFELTLLKSDGTYVPVSFEEAKVLERAVLSGAAGGDVPTVIVRHLPGNMDSFLPLNRSHVSGIWG